MNRSLRQFSKFRRLALAVGLFSATVGIATVGGIVSPAIAGATACGASTTSSCTATGTLTLAGGTLSFTSPASLSWSGTETGATLSLVDSTATDQQITVDDATGTGSGWHLTVSATTFTNGAHTLSDTGTLSFTGSVSSATATTAPTDACIGTCTLPTDTITYPVAITTAASSPAAVPVYNASAATGLGEILLGGSAASNPIGWWLSVPPTAYPGTYTSTITVAIASGPS